MYLDIATVAEEEEDLAALQLEFEANIAKLEGILSEIN